MMIMETQETSGPRRPWRDHQDIILRWYDHWLKGKDTGMMQEPPIRILVKGRNEFRDENEWPLARTQWTKFWLQSGGALASDGPGADGKESFSNDPYIVQGKLAPGPDFATAPLAKDLEITGPIALYLSAAIDRPDATWVVTIKDQSPDGSARVVTKGWLKASHRKLDPARSRPYKPYHPHRESEPVPVDAVIEYAIEIRETSMTFLKGHRLLLEVRGQDTQTEDPIWYHLCSPVETRHSVYYGGQHPSYLLLPVIPD